MNINSIQDIIKRIEDYEKRNAIILEFNESIKSRLPSQNELVDRLFKGYVALGAVLPENADFVIEHPTTRDKFIKLMKENENLLSYKLNNMANPSDKFEQIKIVEDYIVKMFDLIATRWDSILAFLDLWRKRRLKSREESIGLMNEYILLDQSKLTSGEWNLKAEGIFKKHIESLDFQEKHLKNEEVLIVELENLFDLRNKLIKLADETFMA